MVWRSMRGPCATQRVRPRTNREWIAAKVDEVAHEARVSKEEY